MAVCDMLPLPPDACEIIIKCEGPLLNLDILRQSTEQWAPILFGSRMP